MLSRSFLLLFVLAFLLVGCGDSKVDNKQPKVSGTPDPKITGPATPGGGQAGSATLP